MPQNPDKYYYVNRVGLLRGSWALKKFEEDARRHHMEDQPGKLVALRLTEYYELVERLGGAWTIPGTLVTASNGAVSNNGKLGVPETDEDDEGKGTQTETSDSPDTDLDESIDFWTKQ